jgi:tetratricopeptide (TPR) repeat protein
MLLQRILMKLHIDVAVERFERITTQVRIVVLVLASTVLTCDFAACFAAALIDEAVAVRMYTCGPGSHLIGLHPAASLECLGGAFTESRKYDKAQKIYLAILEIRKSIGGPESDLVAAIEADLGDLSVRRHDLDAAEQWYRRSVVLGTKKGRALTGLATVLREEGRFDESRSYYQQALTVRAKLFGRDSKQFHDTLRGYERLKLSCKEKVTAKGDSR